MGLVVGAKGAREIKDVGHSFLWEFNLKVIGNHETMERKESVSCDIT
jgi:hypothetical protein